MPHPHPLRPLKMWWIPPDAIDSMDPMDPVDPSWSSLRWIDLGAASLHWKLYLYFHSARMFKSLYLTMLIQSYLYFTHICLCICVCTHVSILANVLILLAPMSSCYCVCSWKRIWVHKEQSVQNMIGIFGTQKLSASLWYTQKLWVCSCPCCSGDAQTSSIWLFLTQPAIAGMGESCKWSIKIVSNFRRYGNKQRHSTLHEIAL